MKSLLIQGTGVVVVILVLLGSPGLRAAGTASFDDVHHLLQQAAGEADSPPTLDERTKDLSQALEDLAHIPHVYHGRLARVRQEVQAVIDELSSADPSKVRSDILEADDTVKTLI
jgi:predicted HAD superfamily Cof-like phosphohydrolase